LPEGIADMIIQNNMFGWAKKEVEEKS